jgi:hypothetical protein
MSTTLSSSSRSPSATQVSRVLDIRIIDVSFRNSADLERGIKASAAGFESHLTPLQPAIPYRPLSVVERPQASSARNLMSQSRMRE